MVAAEGEAACVVPVLLAELSVVLVEVEADAEGDAFEDVLEVPADAGDPLVLELVPLFVAAGEAVAEAFGEVPTLAEALALGDAVALGDAAALGEVPAAGEVRALADGDAAVPGLTEAAVEDEAPCCAEIPLRVPLPPRPMFTPTAG
ncbi:MAG: hypothetical protein H0X73_08190 [Chthoniobacterales bacterium]|nr:hypothetical protein [Chthoniobacterales bacterium]